jgi:long-chain acyl-CoA synthetase
MLNVAMVLEEAARQAPNKTYVIGGEQRLTFRQVETEARRFANVLSGLGVEPGQRVALLLPNVPLFPIGYYGALKRGAVPVPLNVLAPGPEIAYFLRDSGAVALVALAPLAEAAIAGLDGAEGCRHLLLAGLPADAPCPAPARRLEDLLADAGTAFTSAPTQADDVAMILYTSGTTGYPKGAALTHFHYHFVSHLLARDLWRIGPDDVVLMVAPAAHVFGQVLLNGACAARASLSLMSRFEPAAFLRTIERDRVTFFAGVPAIGQLLLGSPQVAQFDLSSLRLAMFGGAPMPPGMAEQIRHRFGIEVITGFGLTEAVPITFVTADMKQAPPASVGTPVWGTRVRIVGEAGRDLPAGAVGEIVVRGPQVFRGYHGQSQPTADAWLDGWFRTGDMGHLDENGYLFLAGRQKEMIKTSGYAVFSAEVERVLYAHPAVAEAAVIGVPHATVGEVVQAFVVLKPGAVASARELIAHCKSQLAAYKAPRRIRFRDGLPKNRAGKVAYQELREQALSNKPS